MERPLTKFAVTSICMAIFAFILFIVVSSVKSCSGEYDGYENGFYYKEYTYHDPFTGGEYSGVRIGFCELTGSVEIPQSLGGKSVIAVGDGPVFENPSQINSVSLPDSLREIGWSAFENCDSLTSITIPDSVTDIGSSAFKYCSSLTSITIPDSVTSIGESTFRGCDSLTSITLPFIGKSVFETEASESTRFDYIFVYSFFYEPDVAVPASLRNVTITGGQIFSRAFSGCDSLTSISIPNSVTEIGSSAFSGCDSLTSISIPNSVTSIGESAFEDCGSLTSITTPDSVTSIGSSAFSGCSSLEIVTIGDSVTYIGRYAFKDCDNLTTIYYNAKSVDDLSNYAVFPSAGTVWSGITVMIGDAVEKIPANLFRDCDNLSIVTIGDSVTDIGSCAFYGCDSLTSITIPDSVTDIGSSAFENCDSLTSITIPDSVTEIGSSAFYGCSSLTIYAEAEEKPSGWASDWNEYGCHVVWGYREGAQI